MRIGILIGQEHLLLAQTQAASRRPPNLDALVHEAQSLEARGFAAAWLVHVYEFDAISTMALIGRETQRIELGTAVVPTFPRHPYTMAQQALTAQVATRGRFTLGIGLSHRKLMENMLGFSWDTPARHLREYLAVLTPLLAGQPVAFHGDLYQVNAALRFPGVARVPLLVAALGPVMLRLAGQFADGTITTWTGPRTLETHTVPRIRQAAQEAGRPAPRVVACFPIAITHAPAQARDVAREIFANYATAPSYQAMFMREGVSGPADIALVGDEATVAAELRRLAEIGVTDLLAMPFPADAGAMARTLDFLAGQLSA